MFFLKFRNIHKKTQMLENLLNKVTDPQTCNFIKESPTQVFSCDYCQIFQKSFFHRTPQVAVSEKNDKVL